MWLFGIWFIRHDGVGLTVGLADLRGLLQRMILWKKGSKSLSAVDTFQSLLFLFPSMASGNFITEIEEKMTEYYKKMRRTSTFVRLD